MDEEIKIIICAIAASLDNYTEKEFRLAFQNTSVVRRAIRDDEHKIDIIKCLESSPMAAKETDFLRDRLMDYATS